MKQGSRLSFRLGRKLALLSLLIGLLMLPLLGGLALWKNYAAQMLLRSEQIDEIANASLPALREALWLGDNALVASYLDGLMNYTDIARVELRWAGEIKPSQVRGERPSSGESVLERRIPINRTFKGRDVVLGTLTISLSLARTQAQLRRDIWHILLTQLLEMGVLATLILFAYQKLAGQRLQAMSTVMDRYRAGQTDARMASANSGAIDVSDELDELAAEFNALLDSQQGYTDELRATNSRLSEEVAERRKAEESLIQTRDAAEAANRAKSVFLANMSHELRTPLNAILGFSSLMRREPQLTDTQVESLDIINRSGEHLLALINDVLEMAKVEAGRLQLEIAPFDLGGMVHDVADMMRSRAEQKGLYLQLDQSSQVPRYIFGDQARLRQILVNLVGNAMKFTQTGGVIIRLSVKQDDRQYLLIEVEDSGPGIGPEDQERIFKPFVQLAKVAEQKGTGLGLTITKQFVELMGGRIAVESTLGNGSLFRVELPVELADLPTAQPAENREVVGLAPGQRAYRILIAEDQHENQLLLSRLMDTIGLETKVAENGEHCVRLFQEWHPDLIWMDRRMPVMDGLEATRHIRLLPDGGKVKIVAVTASAFKEQQQEMVAAGMNDFVAKPYRFGEIYDCLERQLGLKYVYRSAAVEAAAVPVMPTAVALPADLKRELRDSLERLDSERIAVLLDQIGQINGDLAATLSHLAKSFNYPAMQRLLDESGDTGQ